MDFTVEFILDHFREIVRTFFIRRVQLAVDAIDARIEALRKEVPTWRVVVSVFFLALVDSVVLEINPLFLSFVNDVVPLFCFVSFSYYPI